MTQNDIIDAISERTGLPKSQIKKVLKAFRDVSIDALKDGQRVGIVGLGTLSRAWREERTVRRINDHRKIFMDGRFRPVFRPSAGIKRTLMALTPQHWTNPAHQKARRAAQTLIGDMALYSKDNLPSGLKELDNDAVRGVCSATFGEDWDHLLDTYAERVPENIRREFDHIAAVAKQRWE